MRCRWTGRVHRTSRTTIGALCDHTAAGGVTGPGLTNTITALVEGVRSGTPLPLVSGDTPAIDRQHLQKIDQRALVLATGAGFEAVRSLMTIAKRRGRHPLRRQTLRRAASIAPAIAYAAVWWLLADRWFRRRVL